MTIRSFLGGVWPAMLTASTFMAPVPTAFAAQASAPKDSPADAAPNVEERYKSLETLARGLYYIENMYVDADKVKEDDLVQHALKGVVDQLDPHTMLMPKQAFDQLTMDTQGKFGGVGIIVSQERGKILVVSPIEDTPASRAGIRSGDEIISIDGQTIDAAKNPEAVDRMRGEPGSVLTLSIRRKGVPDPLNFSLTREVIKVKSVKGQDLGDGVLYARITSFQDDTGDELEALLKKAVAKAPLRGVVLDLRDNPGGLLDQAVRVVDLFVDSGLIVSTVGRDHSRIEREYAHKRGTYLGFPMVVLVNGGSASASEIVAGALQDHERALILGTTTFGKGSVQTLVSLPDGSGLKLTIARYYTPKDRSIQNKGITPDIYVPAQKPSDSKRVSSTQLNYKEADLKGHIESQDLSDLAKHHGLLTAVASWPQAAKDDYQLLTAFTYLKSWAIFQQSPSQANAAPQAPTPAAR